MENLNSAAQSGTETVQYIVGAIAVVTNTQPCRIDATFCYLLSLNVGYKFAEADVGSRSSCIAVHAGCPLTLCRLRLLCYVMLRSVILLYSRL